MADERWNRLWDIFHAALDRQPDDRNAFLQSACGADGELRREIEELISSHSQRGDYLEHNPHFSTVISAAAPEAMIGQLIDNRYRIRSVIGTGGMGVVYLGDQERPIRRAVAIKLIKRGLDSAGVLARFEAERQTMAELDHPNIARIYDAGATQDGRPYFVMEYISGTPITAYCDTRRCNVRERLDLFIQTCEGIQHTHQRGILHRDIKPSNVLVKDQGTGPVPKVIDFGVAKALDHRPGSKTPLTSPGQFLGTPEYMSPEQAVPANNDAVDARSDLYSLGVLLHELLVGKPLFETGGSPRTLAQTPVKPAGSEIVAPSECVKRLGEARDECAARRRTRVKTLERQLRGELDRIVMKAVHGDRNKRYASVSALITDLRRFRDRHPASIGFRKAIFARPLPAAITLACFVVLTLALLAGRPAWFSLTRQPRLRVNEPGTGEVRLAVLPFRNLGGDRGKEYFSDGLTEEIIARLGKLSPGKLRVIAPTTAMRYKRAAKSVDTIGNELGVDYVLEGSVRHGEDRIRITAQLVRVANQIQLWSESYEFKLQDVLATQTEMSLRVARSLAVEVLPSAREQRGNSAVVNAEAYDAYLKGRYFRDMASQDGFRKSIQYFKQAIGHDPQFAPAYAGIAGCYCLLSGHGLEVDTPKSLMTAAREMAERAVALDPYLAEAHGVLGMYHLKYAWDWTAAEKSLRRAIELDPNDSMIRIWYSFYLSSQARHQEASTHAKIARDLDRFSRTANVNVAFQHYEARQYDQALREFTGTLEMFPGFWGAYWGRGLVYLQKKDKERSLADLNRAVEMSNGNASALGSLGYAYARFGQFKKTEAILRDLLARASQTYVPAVTIMAIHAARGDINEALVWIKRAYEQRSRAMVWIKVAHEFDALRETPQYRNLIARMGLGG